MMLPSYQRGVIGGSDSILFGRANTPISRYNGGWTTALVSNPNASASYVSGDIIEWHINTYSSILCARQARHATGMVS